MSESTTPAKSSKKDSAKDEKSMSERIKSGFRSLKQKSKNAFAKLKNIGKKSSKNKEQKASKKSKRSKRAHKEKADLNDNTNLNLVNDAAPQEQSYIKQVPPCETRVEVDKKKASSVRESQLASVKSSRSKKAPTKREVKTDPVELMHSTKSVKNNALVEDDEMSVSEHVRRGLRSFRKKSMDAFTKVKIIVSRPYKERAMLKMLERVNKREKEVASDSDKLKMGDDVFPHPKPRSKQASPCEAKVEIAEPKTKSVLQETQASVVKSAVDKDIMINGKPFWQQKKRTVEPDEITDDELPLNASVLSEVYQEKIKLVEIKTRVKLNPFATLDKLKRHDELFTKELIFSNTVRSMINLADEPEADQNKDQPVDKRKTDSRLLIEEPDILWTYDTNDKSIGGIAEDMPGKKN